MVPWDRRRHLKERFLRTCGVPCECREKCKLMEISQDLIYFYPRMLRSYGQRAGRQASPSQLWGHTALRLAWESLEHTPPAVSGCWRCWIYWIHCSIGDQLFPTRLFSGPTQRLSCFAKRTPGQSNPASTAHSTRHSKLSCMSRQR